MPRLSLIILCAVSLSLSACGEDEPPVARGRAGAKAGAAKKAGAKTGPAQAGKATKEGATATPSAAPQSVAVPAFDLTPTDLVIEEFEAIIQAPKGATAAEDLGTAQIILKDGKQFWVQISLDTPDLKAIKAAASKNTVQKLVEVHTETDDVLIYESKAFGRTSVWLDMAVRVGARRVHCANGRGQFSYDLGHIQAFKSACESLKLKR
ncbi:MAG: hypothetical protein ACI9U2_003646 [Bradymonadia bacterium]|jgi:hypothetical protein